MNSARLNQLIADRYGNLKTFTTKNDIKYTTLWNSIQSDKQLERMSVKMFRSVSNALGMDMDELMEELSHD